MAVALVHGAVGGEEIEVVFSFRVPNAAAGGPREDYRQRVVVVGGVSAFALHCAGGAGSMVTGGGYRDGGKGGGFGV